jgi:hypothetical protein
MDFLKTHPYLIANLPVLFTVLLMVKLARPRGYGRLSLLSGLTCIPSSVLALLHNESYWNPVRLGGWPIGLEDVSFSFTVGAMAWLVSAFIYRRRLTMDHRWPPRIRRFLFSCVLFSGLCLCFWFAGVKSLANSLLAGVVSLTVVFYHAHNAWPLAATGIAFFTPIYILIEKIQFNIWPNFVLQWNPHDLLGNRIMGLPIGEIAWAVVFGVGWPFYIAYLYGVQLLNSGGPNGSYHKE